MNNEHINKYLTEAMDECWHEDTTASFCKCTCGFTGDYQVDKWQHQNQHNNNFFSADGFVKLIEWSTNQKWWKEFWHNRNWSIPENTFKPSVFATLIFNWLYYKDFR